MLILYLCFVAPVVLAAIGFDRVSSQRLENDVRSADLSLARAIALKTDAELGRALFTVSQLAGEPAVQRADLSAMEDLFRAVSLARPEVNLIYRLDADGRMVFHYPIGPGSTVGDDFSFRPYFQAARNQLTAVVSEGRISPTTNQAVATTVMPIVINGRFDGVVATNLRLQSLSEDLAAIAAEHPAATGFHVAMIDASGQTIADPDPGRLLHDLGAELPDIVRSLQAFSAGSRLATNAQGEPWLYAYAPIPSGNWGVIVSRPRVSAFSTADAYHRGLLIAIGIFLLGGLFFWLALSRRVIRPLGALADFSQWIELGEQHQAPIEPYVTSLAARADQMGHLARSILRMEQAIRRRVHDLEMLVQTSGAVVSSLDVNTVLDRILEQIGLLLNTHTCAIVALDEARGVFRIQASRGLSPGYIRRLAISPTEPSSPTMRAIRSGVPIQIDDTETDASFTEARPRARAEGYRALLAVPLITQHARPAALIAYFDQPREIRDREMGMVISFANLAAMALENATLFSRSDEQLQEQTRRLESLIQSMDDGLILEDERGRLLFCNRRVFQIAQAEPEAFDHGQADDVRQALALRCPDPEAAASVLGPEADDQLGHIGELTFETRQGPLTMRVQAFAVTDQRGARLGRGQLFHDVTEFHLLGRMKNSLIATVSHELRTPLAAIKGYASTLLAKDVRWDPESQHEFLTIISQEADRLGLLVTDLLDLSRIEGGTLRVDRSPTDLSALIRSTSAASPPDTERRLRLTLDKGLPPIMLDAGRIQVALRNLIDNAAKHAPGLGAIHVRLGRHNGFATIEVEDNGPGIPAQYRARVFEPFFRVEEGLAPAAFGAGLGLSISRGFVRAHGGDIQLVPLTKGTCFRVSLPLEAP